MCAFLVLVLTYTLLNCMSVEKEIKHDGEREKERKNKLAYMFCVTQFLALCDKISKTIINIKQSLLPILMN